MAIVNWMDAASSVMTVLSFVTFLGIVWWTFISRRSTDFDEAAQLPFADEDGDTPVRSGTKAEKRHG